MLSRATAVPKERVSMGLNVPPEFERAIRDRVAAGRYGSVEDVLRACLEALRQVEEFQAEEMEWLREQVDGGLAETDGADVGPGDEASRRLAAELRERARKGGEQPDLIGLDVPIDVYRELTDRVASREYRSVEDVLRRCLHLLERVEPTDEEKLEALRRDVRVGLDQFERGEYSPMDEAFARLNAPLDRSRSR